MKQKSMSIDSTLTRTEIRSISGATGGQSWKVVGKDGQGKWCHNGTAPKNYHLSCPGNGHACQNPLVNDHCTPHCNAPTFAEQDAGFFCCIVTC
ncbi:MAG: hypothetical protein QM528_06095 [Phycisphaerales bacterium]|nr:hypothetical protein [Phycisphaerales bacterium]